MDPRYTIRRDIPMPASYQYQRAATRPEKSSVVRAPPWLLWAAWEVRWRAGPRAAGVSSLHLRSVDPGALVGLCRCLSRTRHGGWMEKCASSGSPWGGWLLQGGTLEQSKLKLKRTLGRTVSVPSSTLEKRSREPQVIRQQRYRCCSSLCLYLFPASLREFHAQILILLESAYQHGRNLKTCFGYFMRRGLDCDEQQPHRGPWLARLGRGILARRPSPEDVFAFRRRRIPCRTETVFALGRRRISA
ncbi:hypothetical protein K438DRAFT_545340 [Mycena galopus ATCC 62051]|nr:hypothetical protein K438DRAFT_545340 [Mycena galopus ATCC 62051]